MHFSEVEKLAENEVREFNIKVNGKFWHGPVRPVYQEVTTVSSPSALTGAKRYEISLSKTETSNLSPILNAFEIYIVKDFSQSEGSLSNRYTSYLKLSTHIIFNVEDGLYLDFFIVKLNTMTIVDYGVFVFTDSYVHAAWKLFIHTRNAAFKIIC
jgi:hypothetical protein